jgi:glycosyltransferase involved in cell wall biosynthesis
MASDRLSVSVAIATYNGERWLDEQLRSIAVGCSSVPLEIIVRDDCSTDDTQRVIDRCVADGLPVRLISSPARLGVTGNFAETIRECEGSIIALADQDDVWFPHKLDRLVEVFQSRPAVGLVFSDALAVDAEGRNLGYHLFDAVGLTASEKRQARSGRTRDVLLKHYVVTGATIAFRAEYKDLILPIPRVALHDAWIASTIAGVAPVHMIEEPLIEYRQHPAQVQGQRPLSLLQQVRAARLQGPEYLIQEAERCEAIRDRLTSRAIGPSARWLADPWYVEQLGRKANHLRRRARAYTRATSRLILVAEELLAGHYSRFGHWWKTPLGDLFIDR